MVIVTMVRLLVVETSAKVIVYHDYTFLILLPIFGFTRKMYQFVVLKPVISSW